VQQQRCRKLEEEREELKLGMQSAENTGSSKLSEIRQLREERNSAQDRLALANKKLQTLEPLQSQVVLLKKEKED